MNWRGLVLNLIFAFVLACLASWLLLFVGSCVANGVAISVSLAIISGLAWSMSAYFGMVQRGTAILPGNLANLIAAVAALSTGLLTLYQNYHIAGLCR